MEKYCNFCKMFFPVEGGHFTWVRDSRYLLGGKYRCLRQISHYQKVYRLKRRKDPVRLLKIQEYFKEYHKQNNVQSRYKAYRSFDKKKGLEDTISGKDFRELVKTNCHYCGEVGSLGLDRRDNQLGHSKENVVPCCEKCNIILGDIPHEAKDVLIQGLTEIRKRGLLDRWTIPTKRRREQIKN